MFLESTDDRGCGYLFNVNKSKNMPVVMKSPIEFHSIHGTLVRIRIFGSVKHVS